MENYYDSLSPLAKDMLKEVGSIGTGNAATAMSQLLGLNVNITIPDVRIMSFNDTIFSIGSPEDEVMAVVSQIQGDLSGIMMFVFKLDFAGALSQVMMNQTLSSYDDIDYITTSAIKEAGNIINSSYIGAMSTLAGMDIKLSAPGSTINMLGGVMNIAMIQVGYNTNNLLMVAGKFIVGDKQLEGCLLMVPTVDSLDKLIKRLGGGCD